MVRLVSLMDSCWGRGEGSDFLSGGLKEYLESEIPLVVGRCGWEYLLLERALSPRVRCCATRRWGLGLALVRLLRKSGLDINGRKGRGNSKFNREGIINITDVV